MTTFRGNLFTRLAFRDYHVFVPFVCRCCGECCWHYVPSIPEGNLMRIADDLGLSREELFRRHSEAVQKYNVAVRSFPANLLAGIFGFKPGTFFEAPGVAKTAPQVKF